MANERILVIDDDRTVHTFLKAVFGKAGYKVYSALDALQGPMVARQFNPDLIVLDLALPGGGGPSVLQRVRTMQGMMQIPVLVYSGIGRERVEQLVPAAPDVVHIAKPGTPEEILQAVASLLGGRST